MGEGHPHLEAGPPLLGLRPGDGLWEAWLTGGDGPLASCREGLQQLWSPWEADGHPRLGSLGDTLIDEMALLVEPPEHRAAIGENIHALKEGRAVPIVTGQQPGFAGGPLYTLYKIAAVVELASLLRARGRPAVPVFWLGDDDDDVREALAPRVAGFPDGPLQASTLKPRRDGGRHPMVGTLPASALEEGWSASVRPGPWRQILSRAKAEEDDLSRLTTRCLWQVFGDAGLVIVRGNDPHLHREAAEFYRQVAPRLDELRESARQGRQKAVKEFGAAPLAENSLQRPWYQARGGWRRPLTGGEIPADTGSLRCGVMLRSLLQDWLLRPAAVVVGPGELAYLAQLAPLHAALGVRRAPLLPRLFGWAVPADLPTERLFDLAGPVDLDAREADELARQAAEPSREVLTQLLGEMGLEPDRATSLAEARNRRWIKGVRSMLQDESRRLLEQRRQDLPAWIFPGGRRQERHLAWVPLADHWGPSFLAAVRQAAREHWRLGLHQDWREFVLRLAPQENEPTEGDV